MPAHSCRYVGDPTYSTVLKIELIKENESMTQQLISCIPNFSEGRNQSIIKQIARSIEAVDGVTLLDIHSGKDLNRTVTTFIGTPRSVIEAAIN